jgi:hypothetical protein
MNRIAWARRIRAGSVIALISASGLILAACSSNSPGSAANSAGTGTGSGSGAASGSGSGSGSSSGSGSGSSGGSASVVSSASVPFPIAVGETWKYKDPYGTTVNKIASVKPVSGGQQVTMDDAITTVGSTTRSSAYFVFHSDGSISYPFNQFNTSSSEAQVKLISGGLLWPPAAELASGKPYHDILKIEFIAGGKKMTVTAHVTVQGGGTATVTVPAGTYSASVVNMTMSETVEGFKASSEVRTWLANGVGPVKTEVIIDEAGTSKVAAEDQLISFTK